MKRKQSRRRRVIMIFIRILVYTFLAWFVLRWLEGRMTFVPSRPWELDPQAVAPAEEITFESEDGVELSGVWLPYAEAQNPKTQNPKTQNQDPGVDSPSVPKGVVLFCHGNAGNLSHRLTMADSWRARGYSIFLFDYRGYGRSKGRPSERGLLLDTRAAYRETLRLGGQLPIVAGRSLGTAPAVLLAAEQPVRGLLLDSPMSSARDMASSILPIPGLRYLIAMRLDNERNIARVSCPILIIHGENDEVVPFDQGRKVFDAAPEPKQFLPLRLGHNDPRESPAIHEARDRFFESLPRD